jgi:GNAT superfamily N-acetyltransferase
MGSMTAIDLSELTSTHDQRLHAVDRLLPVSTIPQTGEDTELFGVEVAKTVAVGVARDVEHDPDTMAAMFGALRRHGLTVRIAGPEPGQAVDALLTEWDAHLDRTARHADPESAAVLSWPSRDTGGVLALTRHGFTAVAVLAVRPIDRPTPPVADIRIRPALAADLDTATELNIGLIDYDAQFGLVTRRPKSAELLREPMAAAIGQERVWLAEQDEDVVGLLVVEFPSDNGRAATLVSADPVGYIDCMYVRPEIRGAGVGSALVAVGHQALAAVGAQATLLHHALPNPMSTPFWYSHGYRPLWTIWQRRPAVR